MANKQLTMAGLGAMVLGVVVIIVLYGIIPVIGSEVDGATTIDAASQWNSTTNTDIPTGPDFWTSISGFVTLSAMMLFVGGFLGVLKGIRG